MVVPAQELTIEYVPHNAVTQHPRNPRRGDVATIVRSIKAHRQYVPLTVQRSTGFILRGNHTHLALGEVIDEEGQDRGDVQIAVVFIDVDDREALEILLDDNHASDKGHYHNETLAEILADLDTLPPTFLREDYDDLLLQLTPKSLDDLADELGDHDPADVWPHVRLQMSPVTKARFEEWWRSLPGDTDEARALTLLPAVES